MTENKELGSRVGNRNTWLHGKANFYLQNNTVATKEGLIETLMKQNKRLEKPLPYDQVLRLAEESWRNRL